MPNPRRSQLELNFDGLTDSVTNLVGALILLIVLLIGITRQAVLAPLPGTVPDSAGAEQSADAEETLSQFLKQVELIRTQTMQFRHQCSLIEEELLTLNTTADQILNPPTATNE